MARRQGHVLDLADVPGRHDQPARIGVAAQLVEQRADLVDVPAVRGGPRAPLHAVDRAELAVGAGPLVPDAHAVLVQPADVGLAAQEPEQLVGDRAEVHALGGDQREAGAPGRSAAGGRRPIGCRCRCGRPCACRVSRTCRSRSSYWVSIPGMRHPNPALRHRCSGTARPFQVRARRVRVCRLYPFGKGAADVVRHRNVHRGPHQRARPAQRERPDRLHLAVDPAGHPRRLPVRLRHVQHRLGAGLHPVPAQLLRDRLSGGRRLARRRRRRAAGRPGDRPAGPQEGAGDRRADLRGRRVAVRVHVARQRPDDRAHADRYRDRCRLGDRDRLHLRVRPEEAARLAGDAAAVDDHRRHPVRVPRRAAHPRRSGRTRPTSTGAGSSASARSRRSSGCSCAWRCPSRRAG